MDVKNNKSELVPQWQESWAPAFRRVLISIQPLDLLEVEPKPSA